MEPFAHLHVHTEYSLLDGQCKIKRLFDKAAADGMPGFAITDHGNMYGIKEFYDVCMSGNAKREKEGLPRVKPIFGCEVYVARRSLNLKEGKADMSGWHLVLLAKNKQGYQNLIKAVSIGWVDGLYMRPRIDHDVLTRYHEGLICCSACLGGEVAKKFEAGDLEGAEAAIVWHKNLFGDDYYLELQRHISRDPLYNPKCYEKQKPYNAFLQAMARKHGIGLICTNDVHFVDEENAEAHDHLICMNTGKDLDDPTRMRYTKQEWFKTTAEMNQLFSDVPEALRTTIEIVDKCEEYSIENPPIMPFFEIPASFGSEAEYRQRITEQELFDEFTCDENGQVTMGREEAEKKIKKLGGYDKLYRIKFEADYLRHLALRGSVALYANAEMQKRFAQDSSSVTDDEIIQSLPPATWERIKFELHIMKTMGFPGYFLIVSDFIRACREELNVSVGPGRGSAAGSAVAYCLGITKIDPIKYDLLFERFLNPDRISLPDIDTDFDDDGRARVIEWVQNKYGADRVSHIITYGTMATKMVIKDMARVEKVPIPVANQLAGCVPDRMPADKNGKALKCTLANCIKVVPALAEAARSEDPAVRNVMRLGQMLEGNVRGTGVHACGMIIGRDPIDTVVPVSVVDDHGARLLVTQYDGHVIESTGLIKMDFLGLKTLGIIGEAIDNIRETCGIEVDIEHIPIDDPETFALFSAGRTVGTFQFESPGMQKYLRELQPDCFGDIVAMNALYRPGPMDYIPSFIARKTGREPITYDIPVMEQYLKDTYGITVYQEQVMLLSRLLAGFTRGESDALRKAMGKKKKDIVDGMKPKFIEGGTKRGYDPQVLQKIWGDWEKFASYAFNKSHAVCYAWVAYQTAWLKAHYPAEYMAAVLSRSLNNVTELAKQMDECRSMGLSVKGPDLNLSRQRYSVDAEGAVRFGLAGIKGLGEGAADAIVAERKANGPFKDIFDLVERVDLGAVGRKAIEALVLSGALDSLGNYMREQYMSVNLRGDLFLDQLVRYGQKFKADKASAESSLFAGLEEAAIEIARPVVPEADRWSALERLNREKELVGLYLSAHPLDEYKYQLLYACNTQMADLERIPNPRSREEGKQLLEALEAKPDELAFIQQVTTRDILCGGIVTGWADLMSKNGTPYGILTVEDYSGPHRFFLFGESYPQWRGYGVAGMCLYMHLRYVPKRFLHGPVQSFLDMECQIQKIEQLSLVSDRLMESLTVVIDSQKLTQAGVGILKDTLPDSEPAKSGKPLTVPESDSDAASTTQLYFEIYDDTLGYQVKLLSRGRHVVVTTGMVDLLQSQEGVQCKINGHLVSSEARLAQQDAFDEDEFEGADPVDD